MKYINDEGKQYAPTGSTSVLYIQSITTYNPPIIKYITLGGSVKDHTYTEDKNRYANCYSRLELGVPYVILATLHPERRWVWTKVWQMPIVRQKTLQKRLAKQTGQKHYTPEDVLVQIMQQVNAEYDNNVSEQQQQVNNDLLSW